MERSTPMGTKKFSDAVGDQFKSDDVHKAGSLSSTHSLINSCSDGHTIPSLSTRSIGIETLQRALEHTQRSALVPIKPTAAIELFLEDRALELRDSTINTNRSALQFFGTWCNQEGIENLNELSGRDLQRYRLWRRKAGTVKVDTLSKESERTQQKIVRLFIKYCESIDAVPIGLHDKVRLPPASKDGGARSAVLESDRVNDILGWLRQYRYATIEHVTWEILVATGARISSLVAIDVDDYNPEADTPHLDIRNRPETLLKNGSSGERLVALEVGLCDVINDYLAHNRPDVTDPDERFPLLASDHGRLAKSTIRTYVYRFSRPCAIGKECPHDQEPDVCDAATRHKESQCPSSRSPHTLRRAYISHELASGVDRSLVGGRCDVSETVIDAHYDVRDEHERMNVRLRALRAARQNNEPYGGD